MLINHRTPHCRSLIANAICRCKASLLSSRLTLLDQRGGWMLATGHDNTAR
ncbi:MAG: hypothetical protein AAGF93_21475 [Cyanobacteria bacterium P01_H01_bin.105]